jgi:hypothetical protein
MIQHVILSVQLVVLAATGPINDRDAPQVRLSGLEKAAAVQVFVRRATDCVVQAVERDATGAAEPESIGDLIVAAMPACADRMRAMIESFDRNYGEGSGEEFFSGSFLDLLPTVVNKKISHSK